MDSDYNYSSDSTYYSTSDPGTVLAIFGVVAVITIVIYVVYALFLSKLFKKAGVEGWKAWVPFYNQWVFLELGGQPGWIALLAILGIIPFIGWIGGVVAYVFACIAAYHIGTKLQKESWFVILYVLVSPVWLIWLAVDDSKWQGKVPAAAAAPSYQPPTDTNTTQAPTTPQGATEDKDSTPPTPPISS